MYSSNKKSIKSLISKANLKWNFSKSGWFNDTSSIIATFEGHNSPTTFLISGPQSFIDGWEQIAAILNAQIQEVQSQDEQHTTQSEYSYYSIPNIRHRLLTFKENITTHLASIYPNITREELDIKIRIHVDAMKQHELKEANSQ